MLEDNFNISPMIDFDAPKEQSSYIKVIGVGGGGNNAVNHMFRNGIKGVDFIVTNTDSKALLGSPVPNKLQLGTGLGAGNKPEKARRAADEKRGQITEILSHDTKMVFITAGMGGGTGTGAAPVIAEVARQIKLEVEDADDPTHILTVAVVTTPFEYEGALRLRQAFEGVKELQKNVDAILVINNEKLRSQGNLKLSEAFSLANDVLLTAVKGIAEIITLNAYVNIDFRDVYTVMADSGTALMGIGIGSGDDRARKAIEAAASSELLDDSDISGAKDVLLYYAYGPEHELTMDEMSEITDILREKTGSPETNVIWGAGLDENLNDELKITLIATGFKAAEKKDPVVHRLPAEEVKKVDVVAKPISSQEISEPTVIRHSVNSAEDSTCQTTVHPSSSVQPQPSIDFVQPTYQEPVQVVSPVQQPAQPEYTQQPTRPVVHSLEDGVNVQPIVQQAQPASQAVRTPNIINLYDDVEEGLKAAKAEYDAIENVADEGIHILNTQNEVSVASAPVAQMTEVKTQPQPESVVTPAISQNPTIKTNNPFENYYLNDAQAMSRAERIRIVHEMLRNDPNGAQRIENTNPVDLTGESVFEAIHSSRSEASRSVVNVDGSISRNSALNGLPD